MQLSIIIPVYKVEKYIRDTLQSIYSQQYNEDLFEVIVVNDGTPDGSMRIVTEFADKHANLHIINQENQGLSCARNAGLKIARGEYVWFVDSDDTIAERSIEKVIECAKWSKVDVMGFCTRKIKESDGTSEDEPAIWNKRHINRQDCITDKKQLIFDLHTGMVQRYVLRRDFLYHNQLTFYPGILYEDQEFLPRVFCLARSFYISSFVSYCYLLRSSGSIMSQYTLRSLHDVLTAIRSYEAFLCEEAVKADALSKTYINRCMFDHAWRLLSFKTVTFKNKQQTFMHKHYAEIRRKCLMAGWSSLKGNFKGGRIVRIMMVLLIPHHLIK